jgi:phosphohistidine phosphatase
MKRLTLVRHAKADRDDPSLEDFERPLTKRGVRDAADMATRVHRAGLKPTLIISSPAVRALTTAKIFARELGYPAARIWHDNRAYLAAPATLVDVLRERGGRAGHIMLFGHNPGVSQLGARLAGAGPYADMPTCAVLALNLAVGAWSELDSEPATVAWYETPKDPAHG